MSISLEVLKLIIKEGQETLKEVELFDRPFEFENNGRYVLVGPRQAGKSYMLYKRAKQLMDKGHQVEEMIYIDFDDERLIGASALDLDLILQAYSARYNFRPILFFDEIQNVEGWEHFARRLANRKYKVYITGSNAKMLSSDIITTLGGRFIEAYIFPYSFKEYVQASGLIITDELVYESNRFQVQQLFESYFKWGGFPELMLFQNKRKWLNDLYEKILLGDIIRRNRIKNDMTLRLIIQRIAESVMQPVSYRRLSNIIKSIGKNVSVSSVSEYVKFAQEACIIFPIENYASKFVEKETLKKHYFIDNGLLSIFMSRGESPLLENLIAVDLYRKYGKDLYYYKKNIEVDFYIPTEELAIQVSYTLEGEDALATIERESGSLIKLASLYHLKRMVIITYSEENIIELGNGMKIEVIPAWKWLITN